MRFIIPSWPLKYILSLYTQIRLVISPDGILICFISPVDKSTAHKLLVKSTIYTVEPPAVQNPRLIVSLTEISSAGTIKASPGFTGSGLGVGTCVADCVSVGTVFGVIVGSAVGAVAKVC